MGIESEELAGMPERVSTPVDVIVQELRDLRAQAGGVSYAEIATRIAQRREAQGMSPSAARIARSTVFDAFNTGRQRLNGELVAEIAVALGEAEVAVPEWIDRCREAAELMSAQTAQQAVIPVAERPAARFSAQSAPLTPSLQPAHERLSPPHTLIIALVLLGCVGLNIFGNTVMTKYGLLVFLDMIGTAAAAIILGPGFGVLTAFATGVLTTLSGSSQSLAFSLVGAVGALVWGIGYHRFGLGRSFLRFTLLNTIAGVACTLIAAPVTVWVFGGTVSHASNEVTTSLLSLGFGVWAAVFLANIIVSVIDKQIAGWVALLAARALQPLRLERSSQAQDRRSAGRMPKTSGGSSAPR